MSIKNQITEDELLEAIDDTMTPQQAARAVLQLIGVTIHEKPIVSKQEVLPMGSAPRSPRKILLYVDQGEMVSPGVHLVFWPEADKDYRPVDNRAAVIFGERLGWAPIPEIYQPDRW